MADRLNLHTIVCDPSCNNQWTPRQRVYSALSELDQGKPILGYDSPLHALRSLQAVRGCLDFHPDEYSPGDHTERRIVAVAQVTTILTERMRRDACTWLLKHGASWLPPEPRGFFSQSGYVYHDTGLFELGYPFLPVQFPWPQESADPAELERQFQSAESEFVLIGGPYFCPTKKEDKDRALSEIGAVLKRIEDLRKRADLVDRTVRNERSEGVRPELSVRSADNSNRYLSDIVSRVSENRDIELVEKDPQLLILFTTADNREDYSGELKRVVHFSDISEDETPRLCVRSLNASRLGPLGPKKFRYQVKARPEQWKFWGEYIVLAIASEVRSSRRANRLGEPSP